MDELYWLNLQALVVVSTNLLREGIIYLGHYMGLSS